MIEDTIKKEKENLFILEQQLKIIESQIKFCKQNIRRLESMRQ